VRIKNEKKVIYYNKMDTSLSVIIMTSRLDETMNSEIPKILHKICDIPIIVHIIQQIQKLDVENIYLIVDTYKDIIQKTLENYNIYDIIYIYEEIPHDNKQVLQCAIEDLENDCSDNILILDGVMPLIQSETLKNMIKDVNICKIITSLVDEQRGCGRVIINEISKEFEKIVEEKDCNKEQLKIKRVNNSIYIINRNILLNNIMELNNNQKEYYITDLIEIIKNNENCNIEMYLHPPHKNYELFEMNNIKDLIEINNIYIEKNIYNKKNI
jgi:bifunctional UDP-N-acetylglucosamine pyrophosphorylase/glucosamine-1-phosphate N-acetyltransferase